MEGGQPSSVALLVALAEGAPSDDDAGLIGAGPLENLLAVHGRRMSRPEGAALLEQLDAAARTSALPRGVGLCCPEAGANPPSTRRQAPRA